jgi:hypothetical protein
MILQKTVVLDQDRTAIVRELTVAEVRQLLSEHHSLRQIPTLELLQSNHAEAKQILKNVIALPHGETLDQLPLSELLQIHAVFMELNQALFQLAAAMDPAAAIPDRPSSS